MKIDIVARQHVEALEHATAGARLPSDPGHLRVRHGWQIAIGTALLVAVSVGLSGLIGDQRDAANPPVTTTVPITATTAPAVAPMSAPEWPSFEMVFVLSDGTFGRFMWVGQDNWFIERRRWVEAGRSETMYSVVRRDDESAIEDPDSLFGGPTSAWPMPSSLWEYVPDPQVPLAYLMRPADLASLTVDPGAVGLHPDAVSVASGPEVSVEIGAAGIPLVITPTDSTLLTVTVTHLEVRPILMRELGRQILVLGNNEMIEYLTADSTVEQKEVIGKGFVLAAEYRQAVDNTIDCLSQADPGVVVDVVGDAMIGPVTIVTASAAIDDCTRQHLDDIEALWRYQTVALSEDETERLYYEMAGDTDALAVLDGQTGEKVTFPSLRAGFIEAHVQGPGICALVRLGSSSGSGCEPTSGWAVPDQLKFDMGYAWDNDIREVGRVELAGFVPLDGETVEIRFTSGSVELIPAAQPDGEFPFAAFTFSYDGPDLGFPDQVRVLSASGDVLVFLDFRNYLCNVKENRPLDDPLGETLCGS